MKVQITVDDELWRKAKANAALRSVSLGEFVGEALGQFMRAALGTDESVLTTGGLANGEKMAVSFLPQETLWMVLQIIP